MNKNYKIIKNKDILVLKNIKCKSINNLTRNNVIKLFKEHGAILFKDFDLKIKDLNKFTAKFTKNFANDASRRDSLFNSKHMKTVDKGYRAMPLHSEASYSSSWPEIIWFYCWEPAKYSGFTTICDGSKVYKDFKLKTKKFFLENEIQYFVEIPIASKFIEKKKRAWFFNELGCVNPILYPKAKLLKFNQKRYAINLSNNLKQYCFSNHLQIHLNQDPQLKKWLIANKKNLPKEIIEDVKKCCLKNTFQIKWKKKELCMIDNKRFMHGRTKIDNKDKSKRLIVNIQTLNSNF